MSWSFREVTPYSPLNLGPTAMYTSKQLNSRCLTCILQSSQSQNQNQDRTEHCWIILENHVQVLRTTALSLVCSTAECSAPVWLNSTRIREVNVELNRATRTISGTLKATSVPLLPPGAVFNKVPLEIRRRERRDIAWREFSKVPFL